MFGYCPLINKTCGFGAKHKGDFICGFQTGENRIKFMTKCPVKKIWQQHLKK